MVIYMHAAFIRVARNMGIDDWVPAVLSAVCGRALELAVERFDLACGGRAVPCKARKASGSIWCLWCSGLRAGLLGLMRVTGSVMLSCSCLVSRLRNQHIRLPQPDRPLCHIFLPLLLLLLSSPLLLAVLIIAAIPLHHWRLSLLLPLRFLHTRHCTRIPASDSLVIKCKPRHTLPPSKQACRVPYHHACDCACRSAFTAKSRSPAAAHTAVCLA